MPNLFDTSPPPTLGRYADVALEQGIDAAATGLTYAIPAAWADLVVGERVLVPLGRSNKSVPGYVIQLRDQCAYPHVKAILARDAQGIALTSDLIELARWMAGYYCCPLGMVLATMLPAAVKHGTGTITQTLVGLPAARVETSADSAPLETPSAKLSALQQAVLAAAAQLTAAGQPWTPLRNLADAAGARTIGPVKQLIAKGLLAVREQTLVRSTTALEERALAEGPPPPPPALNDAQRQAVAHLADRVHGGFSVHLLLGVTGSGKTEVYLRVLEHALGKVGAPATGNSLPGAIVLVPEIALTPQTVARFLARFGALGVAVLHSGLTAAQRHEQWRRIRAGQARIVVGARSAIFAPLANLRVVIVDEEHENSYKQDQLPRYHARDLAIKRAQLLGIPVVLGSATPSLESYYNATQRTEAWSCGPAAYPNAKSEIRDPKYHLLCLPDRVTGLKLPKVEIVDLAQERSKRYEYTGSAGIHLLSLRLEAALRQTVESGAQAIFLLNRRGYANYISCPDHRCGWLLNCQHCDALMVYHKDARLPTGGLVRCHHCQAEQLLPAQCPVCQRQVTVFGLGTQRVEEEIIRKFPKLRLTRMDSDTMRRARDYHDTLEQFRRGELDVLLGTQMIAKGLDFPNVRLVGVISADTALNMPDFRAAERTFQLIAQVAGRAGRGDQPGVVIVQTFSPNDPAIVLASRHDYATFAQREIALRRSVGLPPVTRMARIVVRNQDHAKCLAEARQLADHLTAGNALLGGAVRLRGPAPCPIARIAGFHRQQIELLAPDAVTLQKLLAGLRTARLLKSDAHTAVDVDPVLLM